MDVQYQFVTWLYAAGAVLRDFSYGAIGVVWGILKLMFCLRIVLWMYNNSLTLDQFKLTLVKWGFQFTQEKEPKKELKKMLLTKEYVAALAVHEAGHAVVVLRLPHSSQQLVCAWVSTEFQSGELHDGGVARRDTWDALGNSNRVQESLAIAYGGIAAEELVLGFCNGFSDSDLIAAVKTAHAAVYSEGVGRKKGEAPIAFAHFHGLGIDPSGEDEELLLARMRELLDNSYKKAHEILEKDKELIRIIAERLVKANGKRVMGDELRRIARDYDDAKSRL